MNIYKLRYELSEMFGPYRYEGFESTVWVIGNYVIKAVRTPASDWRCLRMLSNRKGPYEPIIELRAVGREGRYIIGVIVQRYIRTNKPTSPRDDDFLAIPASWSDGIDVWTQHDRSPQNAVAGRWVDLGMIWPESRHWYPGYRFEVIPA